MIFVVLPAYNEEKTLGPLLKTLSGVMKEEAIPYRTILVNDGSEDETLKVAEKYSKRVNIEIISHQYNRGLNEALKTGILSALTQAKKKDVIITMDADNTHSPGLIIRMLGLIREGYDVVIASRYQPGSRILGISYTRKFLSNQANNILKLLFPIKGVKDYTCGYRAYRAEILKKAIGYYKKEFINSPGFSAMVDILIKLRRFGIIAGEVPLILRYDLKHGLSKMRVYQNIKDIIKLIIKRRLGK